MQLRSRGETDGRMQISENEESRKGRNYQKKILLIGVLVYFVSKCIFGLIDWSVPPVVVIILYWVNCILPILLILGWSSCVHNYLDRVEGVNSLKYRAQIYAGIGVMFLYGMGAFCSAWWCVKYTATRMHKLDEVWVYALINGLVAAIWLFLWGYGFRKRKLFGGLILGILILCGMTGVTVASAWYTVYLTV